MLTTGDDRKKAIASLKNVNLLMNLADRSRAARDVVVDGDVDS